MKNPILKVESIYIQASNTNNSQQFFQLLHEFAIALQNPIFREALQQIRAKEHSAKRWIKKLPHKPSHVQQQLYIDQYKIISPWYSLNQITVFFERYDWALNDIIVKNLTLANEDAGPLQYEHHELMKYAITGIRPSIFPTIEEYKQYMRRIIDALSEIPTTTDVALTTYAFRFDEASNSLSIEGHHPILFSRNKNPSVLLGFLKENKWKIVKASDASESLSLEPNTIKRAIRQINDRLPAPLPRFLTFPDHPDELKEKAIIITGCYKKM